jgi:hypothetical protein
MTPTTERRCADCQHWRARPAGHKGDCLQSGHLSSSYRVVGTAGPTHVYEETKPDHWCVLFERNGEA